MPKPILFLDFESSLAMSAASSRMWRLAGRLALQYRMLSVIRDGEYHVTEWDDRVFVADGGPLPFVQPQRISLVMKNGVP